MQAIQKSTGDGIERKQFTTRQVTVLPGQTASVGVGAYNLSAPAPSFTIKVTPAAAKIHTSTEQLTLPNQQQYLLLYKFANLGKQQGEVSISLNSASQPTGHSQQ